jgi:hypothetical protein
MRWLKDGERKAVAQSMETASLAEQTGITELT